MRKYQFSHKYTCTKEQGTASRLPRITAYLQTTVTAHRWFYRVFAFVLLGPSRKVKVAFPKAHGASLRWLTDLQFLILSPLAPGSDLWDQLLFSQPLGMPCGGPELCCEWRYSHPAILRLMASGPPCHPTVDLLASWFPPLCVKVAETASPQWMRIQTPPDIPPQSQSPPQYHVIQGPYSPMDVGARKGGRCFPQKGKLRFFGKGEGCRISHKNTVYS